jgi:mannose-6-phosphate isomerase-like protein (cupin superfamily)
MKTVQLVILLIVIVFAGLIQYLRYQESNTKRTITRGETKLTKFDQQGNLIEIDEILKSDEESYRMRITLFQNGICGSNSSLVPADRLCTPPLHYHAYQLEVFTVEKGVMAYYLHNNSQIHYAKKGEALSVTPGWYHTFWSESDSEDLDVIVELFPGGRSKSFFESFVGLCNDTPNDILAILYTLYAGDNRIVGLPEIVHKMIAIVARLAGKKAFYPEYTTDEKDLQYV